VCVCVCVKGKGGESECVFVCVARSYVYVFAKSYEYVHAQRGRRREGEGADVYLRMHVCRSITTVISFTSTPSVLHVYTYANLHVTIHELNSSIDSNSKKTGMVISDFQMPVQTSNLPH